MGARLDSLSLYLLASALGLGWTAAAISDSGGVDRGYQPVFAVTRYPAVTSSMALQPRGGLVLSGSFGVAEGRPIAPLIRRRADGSLDRGFSERPAQAFPGSSTPAVGAFPDGRLLLRWYERLLTLDAQGNPDGRLDYTSCADQSCHGIWLAVPAPDGAVYAAGYLLPADGTAVMVVRFDATGRLDPEYREQFTEDSQVSAMALDGVGRLMLAGRLRLPGEADWRRLLRLTPAGVVDRSFNPAVVLGCGDTVPTRVQLAVQTDGRLVLAAAAVDCDTPLPAVFARLLPDGAVDPTFQPGLPPEALAHVTALALQPDGRLLIGVQPGGECVCAGPCLRRLEADGRLDASFQPAFVSDDCAMAAIGEVLVDSSRIVVRGGFTRVNGEPAAGIAVLGLDGVAKTWSELRLELPGQLGGIAVDPQGNLLGCGAAFDVVNQLPWMGFVRLGQRGEVDSSFRGPDASASLRYPEGLAALPDGGCLVLMTNRPVARLLASGAVDPTFAVAPPIWNYRTAFSGIDLDRQGRLVVLGVSNRVARIVRLAASGELDGSFAPFRVDLPLEPAAGQTLWQGLDHNNRVVLAGDALASNGGILRLTADGLPDAAYGPPPETLSNVLGLAVAPGGRAAVMRRGTTPLVWLSADGRGFEIAGALPPLPANLGALGSLTFRGFFFDRDERLYVAAQSSAGPFHIYRMTARREWEKDFVVEGAGAPIELALSPDGGWLYLARATVVNGMRSGGVLRVSMRRTPRVELLDVSPTLGNVLRLDGEPGARHRLEATVDLDRWEPWGEITLGDTPLTITDGRSLADPQRFYRLAFMPDP